MPRYRFRDIETVFLSIVYTNITTNESMTLRIVISAQEFTEIEAWLLLTFSTCLHNQLSSIHSIVTY